MERSRRITQRIEDAYPLIEEIASGRAVLFAGAGLSMGAGLPGWTGLLQQLDVRLGTGLGAPRGDVLDYALAVEQQIGRARLGEALGAILRSHGGPTPVQRSLMRLPFHAVFTTNFDQLLEEALAAEGRRYDPIRYDEEVGVLDASVALPVVKFHGDIEDPTGVVLTRADYDTYAMRHPAFRPLFEALLATETFFFVGFGLKDPNFLALDETVRAALGRYRRHAFALVIERGNRQIVDRPPYRMVGVAPAEVDVFLQALVEEVEALRDRRRAATRGLLATLVPAREALCREVWALPAELTAPPSERPFGRPPLHADAARLRPVVHALVEQAIALDERESTVWHQLGNALFHLRQYRGALRALARLPQGDGEAAFTAARCHWYRNEHWRVRRLLDPLVYRGQGTSCDEVDVRYVDRLPPAVAMYAFASNWVAEEHVERRRYDCAKAIAGRGLRALEAWLDDPEPPTPFPRWLWRYFDLHRGRAHVLMLLSGGELRAHAPAAEAALAAAVLRKRAWVEPYVEQVRLARALGDRGRAWDVRRQAEVAGVDTGGLTTLDSAIERWFS